MMLSLADVIAAVADHLWQSTIFAGLCALVVMALRRHRAQARYLVWMAASLKFLLPFGALAAVGTFLAPPTPIPATARVAALVETVTQPFTQADLVGGLPIASAPAAGSFAPRILFCIWAAGFLIVVLIWFVKWRGVRSIARSAERLTTGREVEACRRVARGRRLLPVFCSDASLEPGVFGVLRPVLLWPRGISDRLSDDQIDAIVAHELSHAHRRDNLAAAAHTLVQALCWFHPLVWWIGARLVDEREQACDEEVIRLGSQPEIYAESILTTVRMCVESPLICVSGVAGADLKRRIETIMRNPISVDLSSTWKLALMTAVLSAVAGPIAIGGLSGASRAPSAQAAAPKPSFESASVKWNRSGEGRVGILMPPGGGFEAFNVTVRSMIQYAFRMQEFQVTGGPAWLADERIDIVARSPEGASPGDVFLRLQSLLEDRFKLNAHVETREGPIYALMTARGDGALGERIKASSVDCASPAGRMAMPATPPAAGGGRAPSPLSPPDLGPLGSRACTALTGGSGLMVGGQTMAEIARLLRRETGRIVEDRTGLTGRYDFDLTFTPDPGLRGRGMGGGLPGQSERRFDENAISIFTAVQEQLGLKLESARGPVEVLVIDSVDRLIEN
jgi:uncharacterized protein (TIGR03435 family)